MTYQPADSESWQNENIGAFETASQKPITASMFPLALDISKVSAFSLKSHKFLLKKLLKLRSYQSKPT